MMQESILEQARRRGYEDGLAAGKQFTTGAYDEAYHKGWLEGYAKRPNRANWLLAGTMIGVIIGWAAGLYVGLIAL